MKKQKPQKKASSKSKPNAGKQNQEERGWRDVLVWIVPLAIGFILAAISIIWASHKWLAIIAAVVAVIIFLGYFLFLCEWYIWKDKQTRKRARLLFGFLSLGLIIAAALWVYTVWLHAPQPFLAKVPAVPLGSYKSERGGVFWVVYNRGDGDVVTPAQLGLYIEIINQLPREAVIDRYVVEAQNRSKEWFKLVRVDASDSPVFFTAGDVHKAAQLDLSENGLDRQLTRKAIGAYSTIKGWAFFELPQDIRESSPFRITVEDNTGVIAQTTEDDNSPSPTKDYVQSAPLHLAAGLKDLTGYRSMMYSELFKERIPN